MLGSKHGACTRIRVMFTRLRAVVMEDGVAVAAVVEEAAQVEA